MKRLSIPELPADCDVIKAAILYAEAGWYVGPLARGTKNPGSILGKDWPSKTSRDVETIVGWFAGTEAAGLFLHVGRSGAVVLDVDDWDALPDWMVEELLNGGAPYQRTRRGDAGRGHYFYACPPGRTFGNGLGALPKGWGEVRGVNGVVVVAPSEHAEHANGGLYQMVRHGDLPEIPTSIGDHLPDGTPGQDAVTDEALRAARDRHRDASHPRLLAAPLHEFTARVAGGGSRHESAVAAACWLAREAAAGLYPLGEALEALGALFVAAMGVGVDGARSLPQRRAQAEWEGIAAWAVGQVTDQDVAEVRQRVEKLTSPTMFATLTPPATEVEVQDPVVDWTTFWDLPDDEEWILEPLIPARRLVALYSAPKVGKSLLMLELAVGIARGALTLGVTPRRCRVLYVDFENDLRGDVRSRLRAMGHGPGSDLDGLRFLSMPSVLYLDTAAGGARLLAVAEREQVEVVVIDTVSRAVSGPENDNDTWLAFYRHTGQALKARGIALVRLDHTGKDPAKGQRGGSAKVGDVDAVWQLTKVTDDTLRLTLDAARLPITETEIVLTRLTDPLRHQVEASGWVAASDAAQVAAWEYLDRHGVPREAGRDTARRVLKGSTIQIGNAALTRMLSVRKVGNACPGQVDR